MKLSRRAFTGALASAPFFSLAAAPLVGVGLAGCKPEPKTPLAHLKGPEWVHGVYEMHAQRYLDVQMGAETQSHGAYRVLAQKGVTALAALQTREVPFFLKVDAETNAFVVARTVPERLTFTPAMTDDDRRAATEDWKKAREHIHTDYFEIHRLNWAMTTLLGQLVRIHSAMEQAEIEQYKIVRELGELRDGGATPYQLPENVRREDYTEVMVLLLARLEDDRQRLAVIEASIAAVGLTSRATDGGSGSLAANINKVMLAVMRDADATTPKPAEYPRQQRSHDELVAMGRALAAQIEASAEFVRWKKDEQTKEIEKLGVLLSITDTFTHLPTSAVFHAVLGVWKGDGDYLTYLKVVAKLVPGGGQVAKTVGDAIEMSEKARKVAATARAALRRGLDKDAIAAAAQAEIEQRAGGLLNTATRFGRDRVERQLAFISDKKELSRIQEAVASTSLGTVAMPEIPRPPPR
jgi:hypothetical protein